MDIQAYFEEWSRSPGDVVRMAIGTSHPTVHASFVRLQSGPGKGENNAGLFVKLSSILDKAVAVSPKSTIIGSYAELPLPQAVDSNVVSVHCWVFPTAAQRQSDQVIWSLGDLSLFIQEAALHLRSGSTLLASLPGAIVSGHWYSVVASVGNGKATLDIRRLDGKVKARRRAEAEMAVGASGASTLMLATSGVDEAGSPRCCYNGKIDTPSLYLAPLSDKDIATLHEGRACATQPWACWELDKDFASAVISPRGLKGKAGRIVNGAERGVTGRNWDGRSDSFTEVPGHYCALQFHDDDMVDAGWSYDLEFALPNDLRSGVYLVRLKSPASVNYYPLFVKGEAQSRAPILFLIPTNTYLAYANDHLAALDFSAVMAHEKVVPEDEQYLFEHREPGRSCYDRHSDGSPVRYSSRRRPLFNVRPNAVNWLTGSHRHYPVDMYILEWLEHVGIDYHVATDEDLERDGRALLDRYNVVVTGSHPEYWSRSGLDVLEGYLGNGGRLMYLGGNGFYWVTSRFPGQPWVIEVRRDNTGTRCWDAPYGERTHVATAEAGGIWRTRGRAPNKIVGIGFSSEGFSKGCGYRRLEASYDSPASRFFEGVASEVIGDQGHVLGGAVADEIDRYDQALGSPEHAFVLATSTGLGNEYQVVIEDMTLMLPDLGGEQRPDLVRADMVVFPVDGGGCVFSVGSIAYGGALAWKSCDNDLSRVTANVLKAFASADPVFPPES
ncbi:MAG: N,N-dimethylformamidase beta subunit family domain-containing protein [Rhizobiaceae bacterium]